MKNDLGGDYQLANDLDCGNFDPEGNGKGFRPVGLGGWIYTPFEGHFDGAGHVIRNLTIHRPLEDSVGLFGLAGAAVIERVGLEDVSIVGYEAVGAVVGATEGTLVREVYATGAISGHLSGSVVGFLKHEGILRDSYSRLAVDWGWQGGLLCDYLYYDAQLQHSYSAGTGDAGRLYGDLGEGGIPSTSTTSPSTYLGARPEGRARAFARVAAALHEQQGPSRFSRSPELRLKPSPGSIS